MSRFKAMASALVIPLALGAALSQGVGEAEAQANKQRKVYSAKFLCGEFQPAGICVSGNPGANCSTDADCFGLLGPGVCDVREGPVKPGNYQTAINIVNPTRMPISFVKKAVLLYDGSNPPQPGDFEIPKPPGQLLNAFLEENWGMEIDCPDIREVLLQLPPQTGASPPNFIKGFVEIEVFNANDDLDIVAAYTSHGFTGGGSVCSVGGAACDPADPNDPCISLGGVCDPVPVVAEGFSTDVEKIEATITP